MDFDFDASIDDMANHQPQNVVSMHQLLNNPATPSGPHVQPMQWTASSQASNQELPAMQVQDTRQGQRPPHHRHHQSQHDQKQHPRGHQYLPQPMHPQEMRHPHDHHQHQQSHQMITAEVKPLAQKQPSTYPRPDGFPQVDLEVAIQMGGLRYADLRKEQAREWFKEKKKNEHMAKGEFESIKRRKKGDTSMTPREKYVRRLKMNQDSAAAARYAQEEYVSVLEKLVQTTEMELTHIRQQNGMLHKKVSDLQAAAEDTAKLDVQSFLDAPDRFKKFDPLALSKWLDMVTSPAPVSAQDNNPDFAAGKMGVQPAPAV